MLASVTHILPNMLIRRERLLPLPGRVMVRAGQKVSANDVIAEAAFHTQHLLLDISRGLGLPAAQVDTHITRKIGDEVSEGDVVAGPVGLFSRVVRAPCNGKVVAVGEGQVMLEVDSAPYEVRAGVPGMVTELVPDRGAIIETTGALIQGVWGNSRLDQGILTVLAKDPEEELTPEHIDVSLRGAVVLAGPVLQAEVLQLAEQIPLRGLIVSSLAPDLINQAKQMTVPVLVVEGFGRIAMDDMAFKLLAGNERSEVIVNACAWNRYSGDRPEVVIPTAAGSASPAKEEQTLGPGQTVRVLRAPYQGKVGRLSMLRPGLTAFPSGLRTPAAAIALPGGEIIDVPLANLEVLS